MLIFLNRRAILKKNKRKEIDMETVYYRVLRIEGEYAILCEKKSGEELFIAMALLPPNVDVGTFLKYEMFSYETITEGIWNSVI